MLRYPIALINQSKYLKKLLTLVIQILQLSPNPKYYFL